MVAEISVKVRREFVLFYILDADVAAKKIKIRCSRITNKVN